MCPFLCPLLWPLLFLILNPPFFCWLVVCLLLFFVLDLPMFCCLIMCSLLFLILDPLLFSCLVICPLWLHLQLFSCLVMFLFLVAEFQLFFHHYFCLVYLFLLDLHLLEYSNNPCQINLGSVCQLALQSSFIHFQLLIRIIQIIIKACII